MYFTIENAQKYIKDLARHIYEEELHLDSLKHGPEDCADAHLPEFDDSAWKEFQVGGSWAAEMKFIGSALLLLSPLRRAKTALYLVVGSGDQGGLRGAESSRCQRTRSRQMPITQSCS